MNLRLAIEAMKGVAILMIVGVHARRGWFGWHGVHVFLVISGFVLARAAGGEPLDVRAWFRRRAMRILPSYWLTALAGAVLAALLPGAMRLSRTGNELTAADLFLRDLLLIRNADYSTMFGPVNASLWYVPLLLGLYLCFPVWHGLFRRAASLRACLTVAGLAVGIEVLTRAAAVQWLDGIPVGAGHGFLHALGPVAQPGDALPPTVRFQLWAPFGAFPARLGEFTVGMLAGVLWSRDPARLETVMMRPRTALLAALVWLSGSLLAHYRLGWIVCDLLISVGLPPLLLHLLIRLQAAAPRLSGSLVWLGGWSYYLFLTHVLVATAAGVMAARVATGAATTITVMAVTLVVGLVLSCKALRAVDTTLERVSQ
jgi:peptidoglycan/LPS O-acetylase OafA/YrhL